MKRLMAVTMAMAVGAAAFAQSAKEQAFESKLLETAGMYLDAAQEHLNGYEKPVLKEPELPAISGYSPVQESKAYRTEAYVIHDMNEMWYELYGEGGRIVAMPNDVSVDSIDWDYSGNTVYVVFSDDMFDGGKYAQDVAVYVEFRGDRKPTAGEGVCPVIFLRERTLYLDGFDYDEYMRPVLVHEMIHYAIDLYEDFTVEHQHDETFKTCAKNIGKELGMTIKTSASSYEWSVLVGE